jgi:class 3 adenylate cyclase/tetratricopeptide (TPR) repeat protein
VSNAGLDDKGAVQVDVDVAIDQESAFAPYLPRFTRRLAAQETDAAPVLEGTLLSADISGFTALSERLAQKGRAGAEELILVISGVFEGLIGIAHRRGGDVLKFRGDALLILFEGSDHTQRACRAAAEMQWLIENVGPGESSVGPVSLRMSIGVHSGALNFFVAGSTHRELIVAGPAATETLRLEDAAEAGEILVGAAAAATLDPAWLADARDGAFLLAELPSTEEGATEQESATVDDEMLEAWVPEPLRTPARLRAVDAEHRQVAVGFLKYKGVDGLIAQGRSDEVGDALRSLGVLVGDACAELAVTWLESDIDTDGGKLYLVAGAPATAGDNEERLLRTMRRIIDGWSGPLQLKAGVNRGHAFAGEIGTLSRRTYAVMGDVVNLAARLTARAHEGQILSTTEVLDRSRARFESTAEPFIVKGKERAVEAVHVGAVVGTTERPVATELPLVGRADELDRLIAAVDAARMRSTRAISLIGSPGNGKSRLLAELRTAAVGFQLLEASCDPYSAATPYAAFRGILRQLAGVTTEQTPREAGQLLARLVAGVMPDLMPWLPLLAVPFDAEVDPTPEVDAIRSEFRRERTHELTTQFLTRMLMMPTLLAIDDAHWLDDASRQLLLQLVRDPLPKPWVICVAHRPLELPVLEDLGESIVVMPLEPEDATQLALAAARDQPLSEETVRAVAARSGMNPLFVQELVAAALAGAGADELPETIEALLTERIDSLDPTDRLLLRYASVVGAGFDLDLLATVLAGERVDPTDIERWERLGEFVTPEGGTRFSFRHDLFRAAAYEGLSYRRRSAMHGRVAEVLEERGGADASPDLLSLHYLRAGRWAEAWTHARVAGLNAQSRHANVIAAELYERALEAAQNLPDLDGRALAEIEEALGDVCELFASYQRAGEAYAAALERSPHVHDQARLQLKSGVIHERLGRYEDAIEHYERALALLPGDPDSTDLQVELELAVAGVRHRQGRLEDGAEWGLRAADHAEAAGLRKELAHAYYLLDLICTRLGQPEERFRTGALPIFREIGDLVGEARVLNNLGLGAYEESRWTEALEFYGRSADACRRSGDIISGATVANNTAEILSDQGKLDEAVELLTDARRVMQAGRYPIGAMIATTNLGRAAARAGRFDEGLELLDEARRGLAEIGAVAFELDAVAWIVECLVLAGRHQEALERAAGALSAAENVPGSEAVRARLERSLGYALVQARRKEDASQHFARSVELARSAHLDYELGLTLKAIADTGGDAEAAAESEQLLERLGVVWVPSPPLP